MKTPSCAGALRPVRRSTSWAPVAVRARAPAFALPRAPHCAAALDDFRGQPLVLAFYVADWHPVCAAQLSLYQELLPEFDRLGAAVLALSTDSVWSHAAFARSLGVGFPLLADRAPHGAVARAYGVFDPGAEAARRALFVVDRDGVIRWSASFPEGINPGADGVLTALEALDAGQ